MKNPTLLLLATSFTFFWVKIEAVLSLKELCIQAVIKGSIDTPTDQIIQNAQLPRFDADREINESLKIFKHNTPAEVLEAIINQSNLSTITLQTKFPNDITFIRFTPDGSNIGCTLKNGDAYLVNATTSEQTKLKHKNSQAIAFSQDGDVATSSSNSISIGRISQLNDSPEKHENPGKRKITDLVFTPKKKSIKVTATDGIHRLPVGAQNIEHVIKTENILSAISPDETLSAMSRLSSDEEGNPCTVEIRKDDTVIASHSFPDSREKATALEFSADSKSLFVGTTDGNVIELDVINGSVIRESKCSGTVNVVKLSPGKNTVSFGSKKTAKNVPADRNAQNSTTTYKTSAGIRHIAFSNDQRKQAICLWDNKVTIYDRNTNGVEAVIPTTYFPRKAEFDPENKLLAIDAELLLHVVHWPKSYITDLPTLFKAKLMQKITNYAALQPPVKELYKSMISGNHLTNPLLAHYKAKLPINPNQN